MAASLYVNILCSSYGVTFNVSRFNRPFWTGKMMPGLLNSARSVYVCRRMWLRISSTKWVVVWSCRQFSMNCLILVSHLMYMPSL